MIQTIRPVTFTATYAGYCHICAGRFEACDQVGRLVGIHGDVCMSCWYYFQLP